MSRRLKFEPPKHRKAYPTHCPVCGGLIEPQDVDLTEPAPDGSIRIIRGVPAGVCSSCHEMFLRPEVSRRLEEILDVAPTQSVEVPLWDWPEVHERIGFKAIRSPG